MELVASLPPDLVATADPAARPAASPLRSSQQDDTAAPISAPFDLLLALLTMPVPGGQTLPAAGNALPAAAAGTATEDAVSADGSAKPVTGPAGTSASADLFARLKLSLAPGANDPTAAAASPDDGSAQTAAAAFADLDLPATPAQTAGNPAATAVPAASATPAVATPPAVPQALELAAAASQTTAAPDPTAKVVRAAATRNTDQVSVVASAAARATDTAATQAGQVAAPMPVGELADSLARPAHREPVADALPPTTDVTAVDAAQPSSGVPAHAPTAPHAAGPAAQAPGATAAANAAPLDTRADNWHEALASRVQVLVDQHVGEAHIKLNPPELGSLDVKISMVDDKTFVQLTAGTSAARDELAQSLPRLRELFSASGLSLGGATVQSGFGGQAGQTGHDGAPRSAASAHLPFATAADDEFEPIRTTTRADGRIDLFA